MMKAFGCLILVGFFATVALETEGLFSMAAWVGAGWFGVEFWEALTSKSNTTVINSDNEK